MSFKDWMTWLGPCFVALFTAILGPTIVEKLKQRNAKLSPEQEHDADMEKRFERLRKDVDDLTEENTRLRAEREKYDGIFQLYYDHYGECAKLREKHAQQIKNKTL